MAASAKSKASAKKAVVKKKAPAKRVVKKRATKKVKPAHPLMLDKKEWDKDKCMEFICDKIATSSYGLGSIIGQGVKEYDTFPGYSTIYSWLKAEEDGDIEGDLLDRYTRAKEFQADYMADEILDIADDARNDWMMKESKNGEEYEVLNSEHVQRSRLRIESRKWLAGKLRPKRYGEKSSHEITGKDGKDLPSTIVVVHE